MIQILGENNSLMNQFLAEIRDEAIQKDSMRFRFNLERIGEIFAYEISKTLPYSLREVKTPLGIAEMSLPDVSPVLATILRAGLPMHQGILNFFDKSDNAFISAYRNHEKDGTFTLKLEYLSSPEIDGKVLIIIDPMLASGSSMVMAYNGIIKKGNPKHTHIVTAIASKEGVNFVKKQLPMRKISIWLGAIDDELTVKSYIVPGLGDAGDLAFGSK